MFVIHETQAGGWPGGLGKAWNAMLYQSTLLALTWVRAAYLLNDFRSMRRGVGRGRQEVGGRGWVGFVGRYEHGHLRLHAAGIT